MLQRTVGKVDCLISELNPSIFRGKKPQWRCLKRDVNVFRFALRLRSESDISVSRTHIVRVTHKKQCVISIFAFAHVSSGLTFRKFQILYFCVFDTMLLESCTTAFSVVSHVLLFISKHCERIAFSCY